MGAVVGMKLVVEELVELERLVVSVADAELAEVAGADGIAVGDVQTKAWLGVDVVLESLLDDESGP